MPTWWIPCNGFWKMYFLNLYSLILHMYHWNCLPFHLKISQHIVGISPYIIDFCTTLKYLEAYVLCKLTFAVNWHILTVSMNFQTKVDKTQNNCNSDTTRQTSWMKGWSVSESHLLLWNVKNPAAIYIDDENSIKHI